MFHVIRETEHTPQVSMDFPVSFAFTGSGKSPTGLPGSLNAPKGIEEGFRKVPLGTVRFSVILAGAGGRGGELRVPTLRKDPSHFGARREVQKVALKRNPSSRPSRVPFGRIGGHLGRKGGQKGCEMEV